MYVCIEQAYQVLLFKRVNKVKYGVDYIINEA